MSQPVVPVAMGGVGVILGLAGPFATDETMTLLPRLLYWLLVVVLTYGAGAFVKEALLPLLVDRLSWPLRILVLSSAISLAVLAIVLGLNFAIFGWSLSSRSLLVFVVELFFITLVVTATVDAIRLQVAETARATLEREAQRLAEAQLARERDARRLAETQLARERAEMAATELDPDDDYTQPPSDLANLADLAALGLGGGGGAVGAPPLLDRLPVEARGALIALAVDDHYVQVRTTKGEARVLMRLSDAVRETGNVPGARVHRSHWVAFEHVTGAERMGERALLTLSDGTEVPVSRANVELIRAAGLLDG